MLLVGPPGTGKTLLARAVAGEAKVPFFSLSGSEFVEMFVGVGAARVRDLFSQAEQKAPCIIFIDELDALGRARVQSPMGSHEEREQTLNQLLAEMDGFDSRKAIIIMAATNRPEVLDPALLRPGRFDRQVLVDKPDVKGREEVLRIHTRNVKLSPVVDLKIVAQRTAGFAGADLANLVNEAALLAARKDKTSVEMLDFDEAIDRLIAGLEKKRVMSTKEREIVAYHESGHAIVATAIPNMDPVHKISIVQRGFGALGYTMQLPLEDRYLMQRQDLKNQLAVLLGGRTAEEIALGEISTGAQNDIQRATDIARAMVTEWGMSDSLGTINYEGAKRGKFLEMTLGPERGAYAEDTARLIDAEVKRIMTESHAEARRILNERRDMLETVTRRLLEVEVMEGDELRRIMGIAATPALPEPRRRRCRLRRASTGGILPMLRTLVLSLLVSVLPASAGAQSFASIFTQLPKDFSRLAQPSNVIILGSAGAVSLAVHPKDDDIADQANEADPFFEAGDLLGEGVTHAVAGLAVYVTGRVMHNEASVDSGRICCAPRSSAGSSPTD